LIELAGRPPSDASSGTCPQGSKPNVPDEPFELPYGDVTVNNYALVAASMHAQHNPQAMLRDVVTMADILASPLIADSLRRMDCCVVSDGGRAGRDAA